MSNSRYFLSGCCIGSAVSLLFAAMLFSNPNLAIIAMLSLIYSELMALSDKLDNKRSDS